jgi:cell division initiation protein
MIDLTPLDVRRKKGDFGKSMRGYDVQQVDSFLDLVAERMEELVVEVVTLRERTALLQAQVDAQGGREKAVQDALVTAQSLRDQINDQARREAETLNEQARREAEIARREAEVEAGRIIADAERAVEERHTVLDELERKRARFLRALRRLLERELDMVAVEEGRTPLDDAPVDLELSGGHRRQDGAARASAGGGEDHRRGGGPVKGDLWLGLGEEPPAPVSPDEERPG